MDSRTEDWKVLADRAILGIVALYAMIFVAFGLLVQRPLPVVRGLGAILTTRDALLTDYFGVGGIGAGCVSAGLLTLAAVLVYHRCGAKITGASVAALFLVLGFGLFGKNLLNIWPIVAGVWLYAKFRREPFAAHVNTAFFGCALAPVFSEILFSTSLPLAARLPLALVTGILIGFLLAPAAAHLFKAHMGFSLYNMGYTAGILGTVVIAIYKSYGFVPDPVFIWTTGSNQLLGAFFAAVLCSMVVAGRLLDPQAIKGLRVILRLPGRSPSDFIAAGGIGATLMNMGFAGLVGVVYLLLIGGDLNGPTIGAILTIVGFAAYGKHPLNIAPVIAGVFLGSQFKTWNVNDPSVQLAALFGTTLAPIAGRFGWPWGIVAGVVHSTVAMTVGVLHAGLNLYNNGFAAGVVASLLAPAILAVRAGFGYQDTDVK